MFAKRYIQAIRQNIIVIVDLILKIMKNIYHVYNESLTMYIQGDVKML